MLHFSPSLTLYGQLYLPEGVAAGELLPLLAGKGVVLAGGLHSAIKGVYIMF